MLNKIGLKITKPHKGMTSFNLIHQEIRCLENLAESNTKPDEYDELWAMLPIYWIWPCKS